MLRDSISFTKGENIVRWRIFQKFLDFSVEDVIADVGSGSGFWSRKIAPLVKFVILIDVDRRTIEEAKRNSRYFNAFFVVADAMQLPFRNDSFDKVLSNQVLEHILKPVNTFKEVSRTLKHGGILLVSTPNSSFLKKYRFTLSKMLQKILPFIVVDKAHPYLIGGFVKFGYEGWRVRVGHVTMGFDALKLRKLGSAVGLLEAGNMYLHKKNSLIFWELGFCIPFLSFLLRPLDCISYLLDYKDNSEGLDLIIKYRKLRCQF